MKGELEKIETLLGQARAELQRISSLAEDRQRELRDSAAELQWAASVGDVDRVLAVQARTPVLEKAILELGLSQTVCSRRVESIQQYVNGLRDRLQKLRQEAAVLAAAVPTEEGQQSRLARVRIQIEAITGGKL